MHGVEGDSPGSLDDERTPPRIRDLPGPRKPKGLIAPAFRVVFAWPYRAGLSVLLRAGVRPWHLTVLSLLTNVLIGWLIVSGRSLLPGLLLIVAGLFDIFDGGLARQRGEESRWGAFLDSVMDRASDIVLFGCIFWATYGQGLTVTAGFALAALLVTLLVSFVRAQAEALGVSLTEGLVQRLERYVALMIGLTLPGALLWVLVLLTALGGLTALQRLSSAWRKLPSTPRGSGRNAARRVA